MELYVLDTDFKAILVLDRFESLIWTDRYQEYGDFELYLPMDVRLLEFIKKDYYLLLRESTHVMIIEKIEIDSDIDTGVHLTVTGRSAESILTRRIIWEQTRFRSKIDTAVKRMLNDSIIAPTISARKIVNFKYQDSTNPDIDAITVDKQHSGTEVYEALTELCKLYDVGFEIHLTDEDEFVFSLYKGKDRSYAQFDNPYVIFSPDFDNIIGSDYLESNENEKNVALVAGEDMGLGAGRRTLTIDKKKATGINRREMYVDARDIQSETDEGEQIPDSEYMAKLLARGEEKMLDYKAETAFTGEAETTQSFQFGEDFFMGDIVQVADGYGHENKARIIEMIFSENESGVQCYPTFEVVDEEEVEE